MSIEKSFERIAIALEKIADNMPQSSDLSEVIASLGQQAKAATASSEVIEGKVVASKVEKPKPTEAETKAADPEPEPEPEPEVDPLDEGDKPAEEVVYTEDDVRSALKNYRDINGSDAMMDILKGVGASGMGTLKPERYGEVMAAVR